MVYAITNRLLHRGFHPEASSRKKIYKLDGKIIRGEWIYGYPNIIPMPVPPGAAPQLPIVCLGNPEVWDGRITKHSVLPSTLSLFSGTWIDTDWDSVSKNIQKEWLSRGNNSENWKGIPIFEGDIFWHKPGKAFYVVTYDLLHGFRLDNLETGDRNLTWYFGEMKRMGTIWNPPKELSVSELSRFHKIRNAEARVEAFQF